MPFNLQEVFQRTESEGESAYDSNQDYDDDSDDAYEPRDTRHHTHNPARGDKLPVVKENRDRRQKTRDTKYNGKVSYSQDYDTHRSTTESVRL